MSQHPQHLAALQRVIRFDEQDFQVIINQDRKGTKLFAIAQRIAHKVDAPGACKVLRLLQRLLYSGQQTLFHLAPQGLPQVFVNTMQPFVVNYFTTITQLVVALSKAFCWVADRQTFQLLLHCCIVFDGLVMQTAAARS